MLVVLVPYCGVTLYLRMCCEPCIVFQTYLTAQEIADDLAAETKARKERALEKRALEQKLQQQFASQQHQKKLLQHEEYLRRLQLQNLQQQQQNILRMKHLKQQQEQLLIKKTVTTTAQHHILDKIPEENGSSTAHTAHQPQQAITNKSKNLRYK